MPCNPAVGGLGKGHLVREIDALGGVMGRVIDRVGIQFRVLNRRKGAAVRAPRAQADKHRYQEAMTALVAGSPGVTVIEGDAAGLTTADGRVTGVTLSDGRTIGADRVVLCAGTFLGGLMHTGDVSVAGGREGSSASQDLGRSLSDHGFELVRLKTGTPPRLHVDSLDLARLDIQPPDDDPEPLSAFTAGLPADAIACWMAATNGASHDLIRNGLDRSPLFAGVIEGQGPRYCPSIEDKVVRFPERDRHTLFLEPEGLDTPEVYVNGLSTSLPADIQEAVVHSIPGLEKAEFLRHGYAVEYDAVPSWQVERTLESRPVRGLYLAGQILGTSGYEEAAAQGLVAGVNAALSLTGEEPFVPARDESYMGVLLDDLATKEISEPYRMFTSRAEHRLALRCDTAVRRMLPHAERLGLLPAEDLALLKKRVTAADRMMDALKSTMVGGDGEPSVPAAELLRRPEVELADLEAGSPELARLLAEAASGLSPLAVREARQEASTTLIYEGYIRRQQRQLAEQAHLDHLEIPAEFRYDHLEQISREAREKLAKVRPATLGQAARIDGVRSSDLAVLSVLVRRKKAGS